MKRRAARDLTVDEFDDWMAATHRVEAVGKAADEEGGPSLSLLPDPEKGEVWPTDLLPPPDPAPAVAVPFDGVALEDSRKRLAGWSAER